MITLEDALPPQNVLLHFDAESAVVARDKALSILKGDTRMRDWEKFVHAVEEREKLSSTNIGGGLLLPHARGSFVQELVMSLVRLQKALPDEKGDIRFVIAVAVPGSMTADYLRIVGALARVFRDEKSITRLGSFKTAAELISCLDGKCR